MNKEKIINDNDKFIIQMGKDFKKMIDTMTDDRGFPLMLFYQYLNKDGEFVMRVRHSSIVKASKAQDLEFANYLRTIADELSPSLPDTIKYKKTMTTSAESKRSELI